MKKRLLAGVLVLVIMATSLMGCGKDDKEKGPKGKEEKPETTEVTEEAKPVEEEKSIEIKPGAYCETVTEEMEGEESTFYYYLYLMEDGKGFSLAQDDILITWDQKGIHTGDSTYECKMKDENTLVTKEGEFEHEYKYVGDSLPEDVVKKMAFNLDGTPKITNREAADAFDYMLTADTIDFYDYSGEVAYSAAEEELETLSAAYFELTENKVPILIINTPYAIHAVGYCHVLQYIDGRIRDVLGLDDIAAVYVDAGVIVATYTGGGYGETNYYYFYIDDNGDIIEGAHTAIMESEDFAESYKEYMGEDFVNTYTLFDENDNGVEIDEQQFTEWLEGHVGTETPITEFEYSNVKEVF